MTQTINLCRADKKQVAIIICDYDALEWIASELPQHDGATKQMLRILDKAAETERV